MQTQNIQQNRLAIPSEMEKVLTKRFGKNFQKEKTIRETHSHRLTWLPSQLPDGVVFVQDKQDVRDAIHICNTYSVPIIPFGAGTSLEGQVNAPFGGISLDLSGMNRLFEHCEDDMYVVVQPGLTHEALNELLKSSNNFFPVNPGATATLGGMASTRASGTNAVRYGTMRENCLALEVVLASGKVIRTGSKARKSAAGYDLTPMFIGAEGTLGIITELSLRVYPIPEEIAGGLCSFDTVSQATGTVIASLKKRIDFARIELLDTLCVRACNQYANLTIKESPTLFVEFHGDLDHVEKEADKFRDMVISMGGHSFSWSTNHEERHELWSARRNAWWAIHQMFPGKKGVTTDVCVPISRLSDCVELSQSYIKSLNLNAPIVGHVGDGNFHVLIMLDTEIKSEIERAEKLISLLNNMAIKVGGTCTGEHGIGQGKIDFMEIEHGNSIATMQAIKQSLDPDNILNPGKILRLK